MTDLIDTTEMYLRAIFELEEEGIPALRARIAERMAHTGPTVSQTVARMERDGLVSVGADRSLVLSAEGRRRAVRVMRKHRLAERLLIDVIGLEYEEVHDEACRWEHVMSERVERRIVALLHDHATSPYGNPIPGLAELGVAQPTLRGPDLPLTSVVQEAPHRITVTRISEPLQADRDQLASLSRSGLLPGVSAQARRHGGRVLLAVDGRPGQAEVSLSEATAAHIYCGAGEVETAST